MHRNFHEIFIELYMASHIFVFFNLLYVYPFTAETRYFVCVCPFSLKIELWRYVNIIAWKDDINAAIIQFKSLSNDYAMPNARIQTCITRFWMCHVDEIKQRKMKNKYQYTMNAQNAQQNKTEQNTTEKILWFEESSTRENDIVE